MIELRKVLQPFLESIHSEVYFQSASNKAEYPYIVYNFPDINPDGEGYEQITIEIDGWDLSPNGDTTVIEELMNKINGNSNVFSPTGLDKKTLTSDSLIATFHLDLKLPPLPDDNAKIQRRKYNYQARLFGRS